MVLTSHDDGHGDFLQTRVPGSLTDAVDGALDLSRAVGDSSQRVCGGQTQIVLAVRTNDRVVRADVDDVLFDAFDQTTKLVRQTKTHRIGNVNRGRPSVDDGFQYAIQKLRFRSPGILWTKLDIFAP